MLDQPEGGTAIKTWIGGRQLTSTRAKLLATLLPIVALATLLSLGGLHLFLEQLFRRQMEAEISALAEALKASLQQQMVRRINGLTQKTLEDVGESGHVRRILIVNPTGRVAHAYPASERGRVINRANDPVCRNCHIGQAPPRSRTALTTNASGERIFRLAIPLVNQPRCHVCHDRTARFNGMLLIERSTDPETEALGTIRRRLILTWAATLGMLALVILGVTTVHVHRPVRRLIEGARRIGAGDLSTRVTVRGRGELPELAKTFNTMAANLAHSLEEVRNKNRELSVLYSTVERLSKSIYLAELKPIVLEMVADVLRSPRVILISPSNEPGELEIVERFAADDRMARHLLRVSEAPTAGCPLPPALLTAWAEGKIGEVRLEPDLGVVFLPLRFRQRDLALLVAAQPLDGVFGPDDFRLMGGLRDHISVALDNARLYTLAITDDLTQLYSVRYLALSLEEEINRFHRYGQPVALLMLDLDRFKAVNDTYGHPAGDLVLKQVAERLRGSLRVIDIPCRYGGEEFAVILPQADRESACVIAKRIRSAVARTAFDVGNGSQVQITVSIGVAACPQDTTSPRDLLSLADQALYRAKQAGRNRVRIADAMGGESSSEDGEYSPRL